MSIELVDTNLLKECLFFLTTFCGSKLFQNVLGSNILSEIPKISTKILNVTFILTIFSHRQRYQQ